MILFSIVILRFFVFQDLYIFSLRYFKEKVDLQMEKELLAERERERELYEEGADLSRGDNQGGDDAN